MNLIHINLQPKYENLLVREELVAVVEKVLDYLNIIDSEISISFIENSQIRELNRMYRGVDSETDVLSFTFNEVNPETGYRMLGDILIAIPIAQNQATKMHHPLSKEINLLMIHGILHLLGYDHEMKQDKIKMVPIQKKLVHLVG